MIEDIKPLAADLRMKLQDLEAGRTNMMAAPKIQLLISKLEPFQEGRAWLSDYLDEVKKSQASMQEHYRKYKQTITIFYVILGILALAPVVAFFLKADLMLVFLLSLPVPFWYLIGIRGYRNKFN
ncbi:MAG: hypothetical protein MRZ79_23760 [Bacteroidia bacterium]|nr:hypothetical protein [Bacteroidia bacterium]